MIELLTLRCSAPAGSGVSYAVLQVGQKISGAASVSTQLFSIPVQNQLPDQNFFSISTGVLAARMCADDITGSPADLLLNVTQSDATNAMTCTASFGGYLVNLQ